jgi:hypothetical protein
LIAIVNLHAVGKRHVVADVVVRLVSYRRYLISRA